MYSSLNGLPRYAASPVASQNARNPAQIPCRVSGMNRYDGCSTVLSVASASERGCQARATVSSSRGNVAPRMANRRTSSRRPQFAADLTKGDVVAILIALGPVFEAGKLVILDDLPFRLGDFRGDRVAVRQHAAATPPQVKKEPIYGVASLRNVDGSGRRPIRIDRVGDHRRRGRR